MKLNKVRFQKLNEEELFVWKPLKSKSTIHTHMHGMHTRKHKTTVLAEKHAEIENDLFSLCNVVMFICNDWHLALSGVATATPTATTTFIYV